MSVKEVVEDENKMAFLLADFVVYNVFVGDDRNFNKVKKNARAYLKIVGWEVSKCGLKKESQKEN